MQNIVFNLKLNSKDFTTSVKGAGDALDNAKKKVEEVGDEAKKAGSKIKDAEKDVSGFGQSLNKLGAAAVAAFSVGAIIQFAKEVAKVSAEMEGLGIRMKGIHGDAQVANQAMDRLRVMSNELGLDLKSLTTNYVQFVSAAKGSGMEVAKAEKIFKNMSVALTGVGATGEVAQRAFVALTQMIGKGSITTEEFKGQLGEAVPQAMGWMMQATGKTSKELFKMMEQGQLTIDVLDKFSEVGFNAVAGEMAEKADSMTANFNRLGNATTEFLLAVGNSAPITGTTKALTALLEVSTKAIKYLQLGSADAKLEFMKLEQQQIATNAVQKISNELTEKGLSTQQQDAQFKQLRADGLRNQIAYMKMLNVEEKRLHEIMMEAKTKGHNKERGKEIEQSLLNIAVIKENIQFQSIMNDELRVKIDTLKESSVAIGGNVEKTKEQIAQEKEMLKLMGEVEAMRRRAQLAEKTDVGKLKLKTEFEVQDLQSNPAFLALSEKEQTAILNEIDNQTNEQVQKLIESKNKGLEKLKTHPSLTDADFDEEGIRAQQMAEINLVVKAGQDELKATQDLEEQKKAIKVEMAMQTFDLLSALNARYSQGQTEQLNKQLQQGIISQEAYDEQMRKIKRRQAVIDKAGALFQIGLSTAMNATSSALKPAMLPYVIAMGALQAATVIAAPIPYNKGTKRVPFARGAVRGKDSVHAILTPNERVVPESVNMQPGYSALMDLAQDRKISDSEAGFIADLATSGYRANNQAQTASIDYDLLGRSIAKYFPGTDVKIDKNGIAVISERHMKEHRRLTSKL